jgi:signal transduction histidine kinase
VIHESVQRACRLLESNGDVPTPLPTRPELRQLVGQAVSQVPPSRLADVIVRIRTEEPLVGRWNGERVVQVLVNLLSNAVKYSPPGLPIVVEIARRSEWGRIVVQDRGIGIAAEDLEAVFDGYRTELSRLVSDGSGIGLRLSRRLIRAEGGEIGAMSQPGRGSSFWVDLPLAAGTDSIAGSEYRSGSDTL